MCVLVFFICSGHSAPYFLTHILFMEGCSPCVIDGVQLFVPVNSVPVKTERENLFSVLLDSDSSSHVPVGHSL